jgi:predicted permease
MDRLWQDLRYAARVLRRDRGFSLTTVATLALCLAANIAIFAVVDNVILKPLPFPEADRLVTLFNQYPGAGFDIAANGVPDYYDRLRGMPSLESLASYRQTGVTIGAPGREAERLQSLLVTPSFLRVLRVQTARGRLFTDEDGEVGHQPKVLLTHGYWVRAFGGRDAAVGQDLRIGGEPHIVAGVLPPDFRFIDPDIELIVPVAFTAEEKSDDRRHSNNWQQIGRLAPGATIEQAQSQVNAINRANDERFPQWREILKNARFGTRVAGFHDRLVADVRPTLTLLWGGVLIVLLIGCVNVANLVLVRASARMRELATRHALGAGVSRLARQFLTETALLACAGGLAGLGLGWWTLQAAPVLGLDELPRGAEIGLDARVVGFTLALVVAIAAAMDVLPVVALRRANLAEIVHEEGRTGTASRALRMARRLLVAGQVACALVLLIGAGLLVASFERVLAVDPGFRPDHVLTATVSLPASRYADNTAVRAITGRLLEQVRRLPGVTAAGVTSWMPLSGESDDSVILAEGYQMTRGESLISPMNMAVSDGFFEAMGATLVEGRLFSAGDIEARPRVLVVDERLARKFWPGRSAVGKRMYRPTNPNDLFAKPPEDQMLTVVGVIRDMRLVGLIDPPAVRLAGAYFLPFRQNPSRSLNLAVRASQEPAALTGAVRRVLAALDPELPLHGVRTLEERVARALTDRRTPALLATGFAAVALLLAAIGLYGVLAYQVSQRTREIGIRMALGAGRPRIFGLVLGEGAILVGAGSALGLAGAFLLRRTIETQLYQVSAMDPRVVVAGAATLAVVAFVACVVPARRASKTDPVVALADR